MNRQLTTRLVRMLLVTMFLLTVNPLIAQDVNQELVPKGKAKPDEKLSAVQVQQNIKPAFLIQPLVQRIQGRKGQLLKFEFVIEAHDRDSKLEIRPVAMMQQENGVIMPDEKSPAPDLIRVTSAASVDLTVSEKHTIQGEMRIPVTNSPFLSYGILVREIPLNDAAAGGPDDQARVGIRFVTQYLLRVDVDVLGNKGDSVAALMLQAAALTSQDGRCLTRVFVNNPTDSAMEFSVDCQLVKPDTQAVGKKFGLVVPVRSAQPAPDRYKSRILPKTRLRLEEFLPHPVFSGDYSILAEVSHLGRVVRKADFRVTIHDGDFPAQDAKVVRVAEDVTIEPANVELSLRKGGSRMQTIAVRNGSLQKILVKIAPEPFQGKLYKSLQLKPDNFELAPGQSRKVVVTIDSNRDVNEHGYAYAELTVSPETGEAIGTQRIPIALITNSESRAVLEPGELKWAISNDRSGFTVPIRNKGLRHVPLSGRLTLQDEFGRGFVVDAGYGRWLLPGTQDEVFFGFREPPPPGTYDVQIQLNQNDGDPPLQMSNTIRLESPLVEQEASPDKVSGEPTERK